MMARRWLQGCLGIAGYVVVTVPVAAQIVPDNTLGNEASRVSPGELIRGRVGDRIDGGALRGSHLFHSFQQFNVNDGQRVYFANPVGVQSILTRVTGNTASNILGTLGVDGNASLFLINPNGILFGPNVRLDIAGSLVASTASSFQFPDGSEFSATNPQVAPLLTVNVRPGLQYGANHTATITNRGNLVTGQDLTLAAGNLNLQGQLQAGGDLTLRALDTVQIRDTTTTPFVAAAAGKLLVQGDRTVDIFALNHPNSGLFAGGDLVLRSANAIQSDAHFTTGGNFRIEQLNGNPGGFFSPNDPVIRASGNVTFTDYTGASLHIFAGGSVTANNIFITGADPVNGLPDETITLSDGTRLNVRGRTFPTLDVRAGTRAIATPEFTPNPPVGFTPAIPTTNGTPLSANIDINQITLQQPDGLVYLSNQYQPNTALPGGDITIGEIIAEDARVGYTGNSGSVVIDSRNNIVIRNGIDTSTSSGNAGTITLLANNTVSFSNAFIATDTTATGAAGGDIRIDAGSLSLTNGAQFLSSTAGAGRSGNVAINARDTVSLDGVGPDTTRNSAILTLTSSTGQGGSIQINTGSLSLVDGGQFAAQSFGGEGNAGSVTITARDTVSLTGIAPGTDGTVSGIFTITSGRGQGGSIQINTGSLSLVDGGQLVAQSFGGEGNAGSVTITARDTVSITGIASGSSGFGSGIFTSSGRGQGGSIQINTGSLSLTDGGQLISQTSGEGDAGSVTITARDTVSLSGNAPGRANVLGSIFTNTSGSGQGGSIQINTGSLSLTDGGQLISLTSGEGNAGSVTITARDTVSLTGIAPGSSSLISAIFANTQSGGRGGNIQINAKSLSLRNGAQFIAESNATGDAGAVTINVRDSVLIDGFAPGTRIPSGILATLGDRGTGNAGRIEINARSVQLSNGGGILALSRGSGNAGDINVNARSIQLQDQGRITVESASSQGGNINLNVGDRLLMRRGSLISATSGLAAGSEGEGGNITINAPRGFLVTVPFENNDILSNSFSARGGNITINAAGVFWFSFRNRNDLVQLLYFIRG